MYYATMLQVS